MKNIDDFLSWLEEWYTLQCDGDWEHDFRIRISTVDNPGWFVQINLLDTPCQDKSFEEINKERSEKDWVMCYLKNGCFEGAGGSRNLLEILKLFKDWVEK